MYYFTKKYVGWLFWRKMMVIEMDTMLLAFSLLPLIKTYPSLSFWHHLKKNFSLFISTPCPTFLVPMHSRYVVLPPSSFEASLSIHILWKHFALVFLLKKERKKLSRTHIWDCKCEYRILTIMCMKLFASITFMFVVPFSRFPWLP